MYRIIDVQFNNFLQIESTIQVKKWTLPSSKETPHSLFSHYPPTQVAVTTALLHLK